MGCMSSTKTPKLITHPKEAQINRTDISGSIQKEDLKIAASSFVGKRSGKLRDHYSIGAKLGSGAFGFVRVATHKLTGQRRAVKTI